MINKKNENKSRLGLRRPQYKSFAQSFALNNKKKYAYATEKMKEDIRGEGGEKKGDMEHCLGKDQVGRIKKTKITRWGTVNLIFADIMSIVGSLQCTALLLLLCPGEEDA